MLGFGASDLFRPDSANRTLKRIRAFRALLAVLLAPAIAATIFSIWDLMIRPAIGSIHVFFYFFYAYMIGLPVGATLMFSLRAAELLKLWHFIAAGCLAGIIAGLAMAGLRWPEAMWAMFAIGPVVGGATWLISEWNSHDVYSM